MVRFADRKNQKLHSIPNHNNSTQDSNTFHPNTHTHTIFHYHIHNTFGNQLALGNTVHPLPLLALYTITTNTIKRGERINPHPNH